MSAHTPAPLAVKETDSTRYDQRGDCAIVDAQLRVIGEAFALVGPGDTRPALANATLWSAAPDLLVACKAAHGMLLMFHGGEYRGCSLYDALVAAIAKAEGSAQ